MNLPAINWPRNWNDFEELCCCIAKEEFGDYTAQRYGRSGQKDWGVDIRATNKRDKVNNSIAIQCKFKDKPIDIAIESVRNSILAELEKELTTALKKHSFDEFIFATTINKVDTHLQDHLAILSAKYNKIVHLWFLEDIERFIYLHDRLRRLYTDEHGTNRGIVKLIDKDFLETLSHTQWHETYPSLFYSGYRKKEIQWLGVINNYDAIRSGKSEIIHYLRTQSKMSDFSSNVVAVVYGVGGSGKSTLLRRIAIDNVIADREYVNWWVEDISVFLRYDAKSIESNRQLRHLIFIDDWYRNVGDNKLSKDFFSWVDKQDNVLILIGDRERHGNYNRHVYGNNFIELLPDENANILRHVSLKKPSWRSSIDKIIKNKYLSNNASIFVILYVIGHELDPKDELFNTEDLLGNFKELIAGKIRYLEETSKYRGLGQALFIFAHIYTSQNLSFIGLQLTGFLKTAEFLGKNPSLLERIFDDANWPEQFASLVYTEHINTKK